MGSKLIITEKQLEVLTKYISENGGYYSILNQILKDLNTNYEKVVGVYKKGGEYHETPLIRNKIDNEEITPQSLLDYFKYKYKLNDEFLKQVIDDWYSGKIKDTNQLSKNIPIT